jgi:hypothetical protein
MDFIERIFGISPDGGTGVFEVLLFLLPILVLAMLGKRWYARGRRPPD